jgi:hypothetical protein
MYKPVLLLLGLLYNANVIYSSPAFSLPIGPGFTIDFYPKSTLTTEDCFTSDCSLDETINFYLHEAILSSGMDACTYASRLGDNPGTRISLCI